MQGFENRKFRLRRLLAMLIALPSPIALAQVGGPATIDLHPTTVVDMSDSARRDAPVWDGQTPFDNVAAMEAMREQNRERLLREQQERSPDVRLQEEADAGDAVDGGIEAMPATRLPLDEQPCSYIERIQLDGDHASSWQWALAAAHEEQGGGVDNAVGRCLGTDSIDIVMKRVQNAIIARGFVTTRILVAPQDLTTGTLTLTVVPGRIRQVRFAEGTSWRATAWNAVPIRRGDLLNLRDVEQALENFKRVPTAEADIQIVPAEGDDAMPGESDLVVVWKQRTVPLRLTTSLDDAGGKRTGKLQGSVTLSLDSPLLLNDLFYVNFNHDLFNGDNKGTRAYTAHYSVPFGYALLSATASSSRYRQTVNVGPHDILYHGISENAEVRLAQLVYRDTTRKTSVYVRGWMRKSNNFIRDTEVAPQRARTGGWELGLTHREFLGPAIFDATVAYRRGTGAFGSLTAPEERLGQGTARMKLVTADASLNVPFKLAQQQLRYTANWRAQWNHTPLVMQDRFAIGGRYTVRGFDGERNLMGERGWIWRNDVSLALGSVLGERQELYAGVDFGQVAGASTHALKSDSLAGAVVGIRGGRQAVSWDLFAGMPLHKPENLKTNAFTSGFRLSWSY